MGGSNTLPKKSLQVEKYEIQETTQDGSTSGDGTIEGKCGLRSPQVGRARKTGWKRGRRKKRHFRSEQNEAIY